MAHHIRRTITASAGPMTTSGFGGQGLHIDPDRDRVIAYFNHIDRDRMRYSILSRAVREAFARGH